MNLPSFARLFAIFCGVIVALAVRAETGAQPLDFHAQILPIFEKHCMQCHSEDARKGGLSLASDAEARKGGDSGVAAYRAGNAKESALILRVTSTDPGYRMPAKGDPLSADEIALLTAWIDQGALWGTDPANPHPTQVGADFWSFQKPVQAPIPAAKPTEWARNPIDNFISAKLEEHKLAPSPEADRYTLLRRVSLDLTGLPPTPEEIDAFVSDTRPDAYERQVERLLASPHYGEAQAMRWMDAARYADTNGYEKDRPRSTWPYRDWVIKAFNNNLPYDRFVIDQLAGDLLPNATLDDRVATGFHRNTMLNEEGGIDVEEFRYEAMVDRTNTTGQVFLGLTFGCAQCHSHKYDPISHDEYFKFYAFLNNTDDVKLQVPDPTIQATRDDIEKKIADITADLPNRFPVAETETQIVPLQPSKAESPGGATLTIATDGVVSAGGANPDVDSYRIEVPAPGGPVTAIRIETVPVTGEPGAGRSSMGNFVLSDVSATFKKQNGEGKAIAFERAESDVDYQAFKAANAIDNDKNTGWAVDAPGSDKTKSHSLTLWAKDPNAFSGDGVIVLALSQQYGRSHTLAHFKVSALRLGYPASEQSDDVRRAAYLQKQLAAWAGGAAAKSRHWINAEPVKCTSKFPTSFKFLDDKSILAHGDDPNTNTYDVEFRATPNYISAIRIEVLPDPSLPNGGPGRGEIMSDGGDFLLSEIKASAAPWDKPDTLADVKLDKPSVDYITPGHTPAETLDDKMDTGWSIKGAEGKPHEIVFNFETPIRNDGGTLLKLVLDQYYVHYHTIGRFRVSVTGDEHPVEAAGVPADIEQILADTEAQREPSPEEMAAVKRHYLSVAPELSAAHEEIAALRKSMPAIPTTQALEEREDPRTTYVHHRGEFLNVEGPVTPGVLAVLPQIAPGAPMNRLTLARWIVSDENPLTARVMVNRMWQTYFGRGLVASVEDFGARGDKPTHPELLDWLAVEFMRRDWDIKDMTRLIVTSATYRQSSKVTPELLAEDPTNEWLARAPRFRVEAEFVRDIALSASGLLSSKIGGPSVKPPLPDGALSLVYPGEGWKVAEGENRYRRGMYVYWKRTLPYPAASVFDAPARDVAVVKRPRSNTPLQALTLLNDPVFVEAAEAFSKRVVAHDTDEAARIRYAFTLCASRPPDDSEVKSVAAFLAKERAKAGGDEKQTAVALAVDKVDAVDPVDKKAASELAVWTLACRALLNLDETITRG